MGGLGDRLGRCPTGGDEDSARRITIGFLRKRIEGSL